MMCVDGEGGWSRVGGDGGMRLRDYEMRLDGGDGSFLAFLSFVVSTRDVRCTVQKLTVHVY
jgi:hypothetical protein